MLGLLSVAGAEDMGKPFVAGPVFSDTGPDAMAYGAAEGFPIGARATSIQVQNLVGAYSHFDELLSSRVVSHSATPWSFRRAPTELKIWHDFHDNRYSVEDYLRRNPTTGLLIVKDDTILYEQYQYARSDHDRFLSQSMAKTITAMLIGVALSEGVIKSIDDVASIYVPGLAGTEYGKTPIRDLLHMTSGVAFTETYNGQDDIARLWRDLVERPGKSALAAVAQFNERAAPSGARWNYASVETAILGLILRAATGKSVANYLSERIWQHIGTEADASWAGDNTGQELTFCCFNAVLRDYARFGRLLAHDGAWDGRELIPRQWLIDATTLRPGTPYYDYGYQVWILPGPQRRFVLRGIRGQMIFVDPSSKLVMVHTAVRKNTVDSAYAETGAVWWAVVQRFGNGG
jgi:CubicO group peptidase (beta-lactamase class C family)